MKTRDSSKESSDAQEAKKRAGHTLAEWVSLGASALLIASVAGYLIVKSFQSNEPFVPVEVQARVAEVREVNGRFILPVHIVNRGGQTLRDLNIELRSNAAGSNPETAEVVIDYLGEGSEEIAYFYFDKDPRSMKIEPRAASYRVE